MKKTPQLLVNTTQANRWRIDIKLQEQKIAKFEYSDRDLARDHYDQLRALGVVGNVAIRNIEFTEYFESATKHA